MNYREAREFPRIIRGIYRDLNLRVYPNEPIGIPENRMIPWDSTAGPEWLINEQAIYEELI